MTSVAIIGAGRLGTSLGLALSKKGFEVRRLADRSLRQARESRRILGQGQATKDIITAAAEAGLVFICVPDAEIVRTANKLARASLDWRGKLVFHTSGIQSSTALAALKAKGAFCASFHPVQSFPQKNMPLSHFNKIFIDMEGDREALEAARRIAQRLGARSLLLKARDKILFHAACSLASNHFVSLFDMACMLVRQTGVRDGAAVEILLPLVEGTLQSVKHLDRSAALTGPISRGDTDTVRQHLAALKKFPQARRAYRILGAAALRLAPKKNLPPEKIKILKRWLEGR